MLKLTYNLAERTGLEPVAKPFRYCHQHGPVCQFGNPSCRNITQFCEVPE